MWGAQSLCNPRPCGGLYLVWGVSEKMVAQDIILYPAGVHGHWGCPLQSAARQYLQWQERCGQCSPSQRRRLSPDVSPAQRYAKGLRKSEARNRFVHQNLERDAYSKVTKQVRRFASEKERWFALCRQSRAGVFPHLPQDFSFYFCAS